jgi:hypothetical protein
MRPIVMTLGAAGNTTWRRIDNHKTYFAIGLGATLDATANLTYTVQHSFDDPNADIVCNFTQATNVVTVTFPSAHGLTTSDSVILSQSLTNHPGQAVPASFDGTYAVTSVTSPTVITVTVSPVQTASGVILASPMRVFNHASMAAKTTRSDGNYAFPIMAIRLNVSAFSTGSVTVTAIQAGIK